MTRVTRPSFPTTKTVLAIASAACVSVMFAVGYEASAAPNPPGPGPCVADIERFCPKIPMGDGRRIYCLAKHQHQLAPACQKRVPVLQSLFEFGKQQEEKTKKYLAKQAEAKAHPPSTPVRKPK